MSLERPLALLILPLLFLVMFLVSRHRVRTPRPLTTFLLLRRAIGPTPPSPPRRRSFVAILKVLPLAWLVLALAGPSLRRKDAAPLVVLMDVSASMGTDAEGGTRLERGQQLLRSRVAEPTRVVALPVGPPTSMATAASLSAAEIRLQATELWAADERVLIVTDKPIPGLSEDIGLLQIGDRATNGGIVAAAFNDEKDLLIRAVGPESSSVTAHWVRNDGQETLLPLLAPTEAGRFEIERVLVPGDAALRVRYPGNDANRLDDEVWLLPEVVRPRVGFPDVGLNSLHRAFAAHPLVQVFRGPGPRVVSVGKTDVLAAFQLRVAPCDLPGVKWAPPVPRSGLLRALRPELLKIVEHVDLPAVHRLDSLPQDLQVWATIDDQPLLVLVGSTLVLLQDPDASSWPAQASFPLLIAGIIDSLGLREVDAPRVHRGGEVVVLPVAAPVATVVAPSGRRFDVKADAQGVLRFRPSEAGRHVGEVEGAARFAFSCGVIDVDMTLGPFATETSFRAPKLRSKNMQRSRSLESACFWAAFASLLLTWFLRIRTSKNTIK